MPKAKVKKGTKKAGNSNNKAPQIIAAKGGLTAKQLLDSVLATMEEENWITKKQGKDFVESLEAVVTEQISQGQPVNLFNLVKITPRLHTSGERMVNAEFGNPESKKVKKTYKAKVSFKTGQGIFNKRLKNAMPTAQKLAKALGR